MGKTEKKELITINRFDGYRQRYIEFIIGDESAQIPETILKDFIQDDERMSETVYELN